MNQANIDESSKNESDPEKPNANHYKYYIRFECEHSILGPDDYVYYGKVIVTAPLSIIDELT